MPAPIRLGLIGYGGIAQKAHRPGILASADVVKVTAAADVAPDNLEAAHNDYGVPRDQLYSDYRDMLARAEIDAVDIATPHNLHAEQAIEAANAGKAVVCEKPMAVSSEEGDAIVEAVKRKRRPLLDGTDVPVRPGGGARQGAAGRPKDGGAVSGTHAVALSVRWTAARGSRPGYAGGVAQHDGGWWGLPEYHYQS